MVESVKFRKRWIYDGADWRSHKRWEGHWDGNWMQRRRWFFLRFAGVFAAMILLFAGGLGTVAYLLARFFGGVDQSLGQTVLLVWVSGCGLALALPALAAFLGVRAFRGLAVPLADIMTAVDAVAGGDLSVRVREPERGPGELKRLAQRFNHMVGELERSDQQRRNLTADIAHELRTPLHIIRGNLEGVLDGVYTPSAEHIEATLEEIRLLTRLVEDLRTLSLAEAGDLPLARQIVDVCDLLADVITSFSGQADTAGVDLLQEKDEDSGDARLTLQGDSGRLDQVLGNLVANAIRHTPRGGRIILAAKAEADSVHISVSDTGEGIAEEDLPFVFDRFWRGDRARTRSGAASSGLGLSIANQLVKAHGGAIHVTSALGKGTTFTIELPAV
jgi:two-component system OmpR family sensor kinase/two-component system sensor histidine kinase BaeS